MSVWKRAFAIAVMASVSVPALAQSPSDLPTIEQVEQCLFTNRTAQEQAQLDNIFAKLDNPRRLIWSYNEPGSFESAVAWAKWIDENTKPIRDRCKAQLNWPVKFDDVVEQWMEDDQLAKYFASQSLASSPENREIIKRYFETTPGRESVDVRNTPIMHSISKTRDKLVSRMQRLGMKFGTPDQGRWLGAFLYYDHGVVGKRAYAASILDGLRTKRQGDPIFPFNEPMLVRLETAKPVFKIRELTSKERSEVRSLLQGYMSRSAEKATWANFRRLWELGESGDREAMLAVRNALATGIPVDVATNEYFFDSDAAYRARTFFNLMSAIWTAHIWARFGYEDAGRVMINHCVPGMVRFKNVSDPDKGLYPGVTNLLERREKETDISYVVPTDYQGFQNGDPGDGCGFMLEAKRARSMVQKPGYKFDSIAPGGVKVLEAYHIGDGSPPVNRSEYNDYYITGVRFVPIVGTEVELNQKLAKYIADIRSHRWAAGVTGKKPSRALASSYQDGLIEQFAAIRGRGAEIEEARQRATVELAARDAKYSAELRKTNLAAYESAKAEWESTENGSAYWRMYYAGIALGGDYAAAVQRVPKPRYGIVYGEASSAGTSSSMFPNAGQTVNVRTYDQNGNYTGSTTMSSTWADIARAVSSAPR